MQLIPRRLILTCGVLLGTREGEQFFTFDGEVIQADGNAARNIEARLDDTHIGRYMKTIDVRKVLIQRRCSLFTVKGYDY